MLRLEIIRLEVERSEILEVLTILTKELYGLIPKGSQGPKWSFGDFGQVPLTSIIFFFLGDF